MRRSRRLVTLSLAAALAAALGGGCASPPASAAIDPASPSAQAAPTTSMSTPSSTPRPRGDFADGRVVTLVDRLRVRSQPRVAVDSALLDPLLPTGTQLYVLDGPVAASDYDWYEVVPLASSNLPTGWIASADRDGTKWIAASPSPSCPALPTTIRGLASLAPTVGLQCFSRVPITVRARLISCNCNIDGSWYEPFWFYLGSGGPGLLVEPESTSVPSDPRGWFALNLDPTGEHPSVLPLGKVVEVTGIFDHPAAESCTRTEMDGQPVRTAACRLEFAVTRLLVVGP